MRLAQEWHSHTWAWPIPRWGRCPPTAQPLVASASAWELAWALELAECFGLHSESHHEGSYRVSCDSIDPLDTDFHGSSGHGRCSREELPAGILEDIEGFHSDLADS